MPLTYSELQAIAYSDESVRLTLWKFAKTYNRTDKSFRIDAPGGTLDAYLAYKSNDGSFHDPNEDNPFGGTLHIPVGISNNFLRKIQAQQNEHAVIIFHNRQVGYNKVIRYKKYAPIYVEKEPLITDHDKIFRLVIETYRIPIWIINRYKDSKTDKIWPKDLCEGIAFWLHKMQAFLEPILDPLTIVQFAVEVLIDEPFSESIEFEENKIDEDKIKLTITIDAPLIQIHVPNNFYYLVKRIDNYADKLLMKTVLTGIVQYVNEAKNKILLSPEIIEHIVEAVLQPSNAKMFLFTDVTQRIRLDFRDLPGYCQIHDSDSSFLLENLVSYLPQGYNVPQKVEGKTEKQKLCNLVVGGLINQLQKEIEQFDGKELLQFIIRINERFIQKREIKEIIVPTKIACFSDFTSEVSELFESDQTRIAAHQAIRALIELVAANVPSRNMWPNFDVVEVMLAIVDQIITWGSISDSIWKGLSDPEMGLMPSGRIGMDKVLPQDILMPYAHAKSTIAVFDYVEGWEENYYGFSDKTSTIEDTMTDELNVAFLSEFGISLKNLAEILWLLIDIGYHRAQACVVIEEVELESYIKKELSDITTEQITVFKNLLTLPIRENIGSKQPEFKQEEIYPWRHKRAISFIRRPLVRIKKNGKSYYYFGYRHLLDYLDNLYYLLYKGKFPNPTTPQLKSWLGKVSSGKGNPFREEAKIWFQKETDFQIIPHEIDIDKKGHLIADRNYGDIDLLVIDHKKNIIYSIECKNISGAKTVYEMWSEIDSYLGDGTGNDDAKISMHFKRHLWLENNKEQLSRFAPNVINYKIRSFVLTAEEIPLTYLKKNDLPLPIKAFTFLKKDGVKVLDGM